MANIMADAKSLSKCRRRRCRKSKTCAKRNKTEEVHRAAFLSIKHCYVPGEQLTLSYVLDDTYTMNPADSIALQICGLTTTHELNPYRWPVSTVRVGTSYRTRLALPNPDCKKRNNEYEFIYICHESGLAIGRSRRFKISDSEIEDGYDTEEVEVEASLELPEHMSGKEHITQRRQRSVSRASVGSSAVSVKSDPGDRASNEPTSRNMEELANLIKLYERGRGIPREIAQQPKNSDPQSHIIPTTTERKVTLGQVAEGVRYRSNGTNRGPTLHILPDDDLFMENFLFPFMNGVLEYLNKDGYSAIICRDDRVVQLANYGQKTLDLRQGWSTNREQTMRAQLLNSPSKSLDDLNELYHQLEEELESMKHDSEVRELHYAAELRRTHAREMRIVHSKIRKLERQMRMLTNSSHSRVRRANPQHEESEPSYGTIETNEDVLNLEISNLQNVNEVLTAHVTALERELADKVQECGILYQQLLDQQMQQTEPSGTRKVFQGKGKAESSWKRPDLQRPPVQKATSYAATSTVDCEKTAPNTERKQTTTSERKLTTLTTEQLNLLRSLLVEDGTTERQKVDDSTVDECKSSDSLAVAMQRLFNICSSPSLASTTTSQHSLQTSDSVLEAIRSMFASNTSLAEKKKANSYPATPSNSADNLSKHSKSRSRKVDRSTSMKDVLRWLFTVSSEDFKKALPGASDDSITSLGEAMRRLFNEDAPEKKETLSTSNESLAQAMHLLFDTLSQQSLNEQKLTHSKSSTDSLESVLWRLTDPTPEEYQNVDIRGYNLQKQRRKQQTCVDKSREQCECNVSNYFTGGSRKNPSLSTVIRSSSPDNNVNISYPSQGHHSSALSRTNHSQETRELPGRLSAAKRTCAIGRDIFADSEMESDLETKEDLLSNSTRGRKRSKRAKSGKDSKMAKVCPYCHQSVFRMRQHLQTAHRRLL